MASEGFLWLLIGLLLGVIIGAVAEHSDAKEREKPDGN
jgi:hypothetical protein